jgi:hypothetical protein
VGIFRAETVSRARTRFHEQLNWELTMTIPQNEPGTDVVDNDKAKQPATQADETNKDLPLTEADDGNTRTPTDLS